MAENLSGNRYLVTGAAGFIGARTCLTLLEGGALVVDLMEGLARSVEW